MATVGAIGPAVVLDGPPPVQPEHALLTIPGVLQDSADGHWMNGAHIIGYPNGAPNEWYACSTGSTRTKASGQHVPTATFSPFGAYVTVACTARGIDWEDWLRRAELALEATQSFAAEKALSQGVAGSTNPFFGDTNVDRPAGTSSVAAENAIAYLEEAIGATGREGIIHITPGVSARLGFNFLKECDPDGVEESGDEYMETAAGTPVAIGGGYVGAQAHGNAAAAGESWAFATGPVRVYRSEIQVGQTPTSTLDRATNDFEIRAERFMLAFWDTALQAAVKVDW